MNVVTKVVILPLQFFFLNKVSYVHQLEKKLMNSNNKVADQESKWESFSYSAVVVRIRMQKKKKKKKKTYILFYSSNCT